MRMLVMNETEVCTSSFTQRSYRAASCELLVCVSRHRTNARRVDGIADLSFLADFPHLRSLEACGQKNFNPRPLVV